MIESVNRAKIINDPVHGFISIPGGIIHQLVEHPYVQRLRYIKQLGLTEYVYPGATHSRFQHSLGALHLMSLAINTLKSRGIDISEAEAEAAMIAVLLHDIGHGPFSHALEFILLEGVSHEKLTMLLMKLLNEEFGGELSLAISMFSGEYPRAFFHDLISSQIDMDRLDYLVRDSFFSGVIEGSVGAGRIIKMLNVCENRLVVDEKGIYSIEKFLIARRLMYWQVYMHKTVVSAEKLLIDILARVKHLIRNGVDVLLSEHVKYFLIRSGETVSIDNLDIKSREISKHFLGLDDNELICSVRQWRNSDDSILADLSDRLLNRNLFAIELMQLPFEKRRILMMKKLVKELMNLSEKDSNFYVYSGEVSNSTYAPSAPSVKILTKSGDLKEITEVSDMLNHEALSREITKYYLCYPKEIRNKIDNE